MKTFRRSLILLAMTALTAGIINPSTTLAQSPQKVQREIDFLNSTRRGKEMLSYLHFGATYIDHQVIKAMRVSDTDGQEIPGHVALKVVFDWKIPLGENSTTAIVFFDEKGEPYEIQCGPNDTTSIVNLPYVLANGTLQILGNLLIEAAGDQMTAQEKSDMQKAINEQDAGRLLIDALKVQMRLGL